MSMGDAAEHDETEEDWSPRAPMISAMTTAIAMRIVDRVRLLLVLVRCRSRPQVKTAWCCQHVCGFRYADDMLRHVASCECACVDRRGRALHGRGHPQRPTPRSDRGRHR